MMMKGCAGMRGRSLYAAAVALAMVVPAGWRGQAQQVISVPTLHLVEPSSPLQEYGPYNARILTGGRGLSKPLVAADSIFGAGPSWTMTAWLEVAPGTPGSVLIAGVGRPVDASYRMFALVDGRCARAGACEGLARLGGDVRWGASSALSRRRAASQSSAACGCCGSGDESWARGGVRGAAVSTLWWPHRRADAGAWCGLGGGDCCEGRGEDRSRADSV